MIAPKIENGLIIEIKSRILSKPYIDMTFNLMNEFGIEYNWKDNIIES